MVGFLKRAFYFPVASYFRFWASIQLRIWRPRIFLVTGSSGKTTLLHLIEAQLGRKARYSHHANSSFGIPFDILGLKRKTLSKLEWPALFLKAPFQAFKKPFGQEFYVVEADCDRPGEGKFLGSLLRPEVTMWLDVSKTHTINFGGVAKARGISIEEAVAFEFGYFGECTKVLCLLNGDDENLVKQSRRITAQVKELRVKDLQEYKVSEKGTIFKIDGLTFEFDVLLPKETFYALVMCINACNHLDLEIDPKFMGFELPPGRSSLFRGVKDTTILDSSYNVNLSSMQVILDMYGEITAPKKWAVLSDMTELGEEEQSEHQKLAEVIAKSKLDKVILMGPRMRKYVWPKLAKNDVILVSPERTHPESVAQDSGPSQTRLSQARMTDKDNKVVVFETPKEVLDYLEQTISGGEMILFKGARFLEGVIEHLLKNKEDVKRLCRREAVWEKRRREWGL